MAEFLYWRSKTAAKAFFSAMLARYEDGVTITQSDSGHLAAILANHPEASDKMGCGIARFYKDKVNKWSSCFWLERLDGTKTDFSYRHCIDGKAPTLEHEFLNACRQAVRDDLMAAKADMLDKIGIADRMVQCAVTGEIVPFANAHLDHAAPLTFEVIVKTFLAAHNITPTREDLSSPQDGQWITRFTNRKLEEMFREYHNRMAVLRIVSQQANAQLAAKHRLPTK